MSDAPEKKKRRKPATLQRDIYRAVPRRTRRPQTVRETLRRVKEHLLNTVVGLFGCVDDAVDAVRRLVRKTPDEAPGIIKAALVTPTISEAIARRIDRAAEKADKAEGRAQAATAAGAPVPTAAEAAERVAAVLAQLKAKGLHVDVLDAGGTPAVVVARPELAEAARAAAAADGELRSLGEAIRLGRDLQATADAAAEFKAGAAPAELPEPPAAGANT